MGASKEGYTEIVKYLASLPGVDHDAAGIEGVNSLIIASENGHLDIVKFLVGEKGSNPNFRDKSGWSPIMCAAF